MAHQHHYLLFAHHVQPDGGTGGVVEGKEALDLFTALGLDGVYQHPHGTLVVTNGEEGQVGPSAVDPTRDYIPAAIWAADLQSEGDAPNGD